MADPQSANLDRSRTRTLPASDRGGVSCPSSDVPQRPREHSPPVTAGIIPVLSCEGPCIRGEIARLAGNLISQDVPSHARACHAETFFVPHSAMASWVKGAARVVMIDGCFLKRHGRILETIVPEGKVVHIDALPLYKKHIDVFLMDEEPEDERKAVARGVADKIIATLNQ